jgi:hypothetical protein
VYCCNLAWCSNVPLPARAAASTHPADTDPAFMAATSPHPARHLQHGAGRDSYLPHDCAKMGSSCHLNCRPAGTRGHYDGLLHGHHQLRHRRSLCNRKKKDRGVGQLLIAKWRVRAAGIQRTNPHGGDTAKGNSRFWALLCDCVEQSRGHQHCQVGSGGQLSWLELCPLASTPC